MLAGVRRAGIWDRVQDSLRGAEERRLQEAALVEPALPVLEAMIQRAMAEADRAVDGRRRRTEEELRDHYAITRALRMLWQELNGLVEEAHGIRQERARRADNA